MKHQALLLVALVAITSGCDRGDKTAAVSEGAAIFATNCAVCHGPEGNVRAAEAHDPNTPDLRRIAQESTNGRLPRAALAEIIDGRRVIESHTRSMPTWGETLGGGDEAVTKARIDLLIGKRCVTGIIFMIGGIVQAPLLSKGVHDERTDNQRTAAVLAGAFAGG